MTRAHDTIPALTLRLLGPCEVRLWGAAEAVRQAVGFPLRPNEREEFAQNMTEVREALGDTAIFLFWLGSEERLGEENVP